MVSENRWLKAQEAEKNWFKSHKQLEGDFKKGWFFGELTNSQGFDLPDLAYFDDKIIVEVGCGAQGFITLLGGRKIGVDPLITLYKEEEILPHSVSNIDYIKGLGEFLPISSNSVDVVICYNVLDHVKEPTQAVKEMNRILRMEGLLIFQINTYGRMHALIRKHLEKKGKGIPPHPHCFTCSHVRRLLERSGFKIMRGGVRKALKGQETLSRRFFRRSFLEAFRKILLGVSGYDPFGFEELKVICKKY